MKLGFYYHSNYKKINNQFIVPGYIGVFIEELASQCDELILFMEEQIDYNSQEEDYVLVGKNIKLISLGYHSPFYERLLYPRNKLKIIKQNLTQFDHFLIRIPTPLAPRIYLRFKQETKFSFLLVGNYLNGIGSLEQPFIRKSAIIILTFLYQFLQNKMLKNEHLLVNSQILYDQNKKRTSTIKLIKTTTLNNDSFFNRKDTCSNGLITILYTGRINYQKGLRELIKSIEILKKSFNVHLNIVGWEEKGNFSYIESFKKQINRNGLEETVTFYGKQSIGKQLNKFYQTADIYVIPSYHEGFPRTIWEALAAGLPVVATGVGSIPFFLDDKVNASIIQPKSSEAITKAVTEIITNRELRKKLIENGQELARTVTLEYQTKLLINSIRDTKTKRNE
jgi:glycosyltransferase involved in cell wall biosynthesis